MTRLSIQVPWTALLVSSLLSTLIQGASIRGLSASNETQPAEGGSNITVVDPTEAPSDAATAAPSPAPSSAPTPNPYDDDDELYTIIFLSDMENRYRGHTMERSRFVATYISRIAEENLFFENEYSHIPIDPQLIINGGDIAHFWGCTYPSYIFGGGCRTPEEEFNSIWGIFYDAGIPLISAYGNHDWRPDIGTGNPVRGTPRLQRTATSDKINRWSSKFVEATYQKSAEMGAITYQSIPPTGEIGQSMYRAEFRGLQIASFNAAYNWQSYDDHGIYSADDQLEQLSQVLNRTQPTLFFSHFPLSATRLQTQTPSRDQVKALIRQFPVGTSHFAGHYHALKIERHDEALDPAYYDIIAPYPHNWNGKQPGYLALLVSPNKGVVQVKPLLIPGLEDGTPCENGDTKPIQQILWNPFRFSFGNSGNVVDQSNSCDRCKAGRQHWSVSSLSWICGQDPTVAQLMDLANPRKAAITTTNKVKQVAKQILEDLGDSLDGTEVEG